MRHAVLQVMLTTSWFSYSSYNLRIGALPDEVIAPFAHTAAELLSCVRVVSCFIYQPAPT
jgi:hypothetical protein